MYIFSPHNSSPVYVKKSIVESDSSILGAVFVPRLQDSKDSSHRLWQKKSQLYFIDSNQVCIVYIDIYVCVHINEDTFNN